MKFIEKKDNIERVYSVNFDRKKLKELLNEIVRKTSYRIEGKFTIPSCLAYDDTLPNGDPMYENIKNKYTTTSTGEDSYHDDLIVIEGTEVNSPMLADIIGGILDGDSESIYLFANYLSSDELVPIDKQISDANQKVNDIANADVSNKIEALNDLQELCEDKKEGKYFDTELLRKYYLKARSLFSLQLVNEHGIVLSKKF